MQPDQPPRAQAGPWSETPPAGGRSPAGGEQPSSAGEPPPGEEPEVLVGEVLPPGTPLPHPPGQETPDPRGPGSAAGYRPGGPQPSQAAPGQPAPPGGQAGTQPTEFSSNLGGAIAMFALFPPFAVPATIDAVRARAAYRQGDRSLADDNAGESRRWSRAALVLGLIGWAFLVCCGGSGLVLHSCGVVG